MAIPSTAKVFTQSLDPHELLDFQIVLSDLLEDGEIVDDMEWTLEVLVEGAALGLTIMEGSARDPVLEVGGEKVTFWLTVDDSYKANAAFDGAGTKLPLRITARTTASPYRLRQRTFQVTVVQQ